MDHIDSVATEHLRYPCHSLCTPEYWIPKTEIKWALIPDQVFKQDIRGEAHQGPAYLSESTMGILGEALPMGVTALCWKPVRRSEISSGHSRMLKAFVPSVPPAAFWLWYRQRFSFSACKRAAYCCMGFSVAHNPLLSGSEMRRAMVSIYCQARVCFVYSNFFALSCQVG